ncbi:MAG TPA: multicopper oxidase domain-containing protein [Polyangia bacterium]|nr:multicopper oxidase domain-containing protein [Polyangia bacterium]
MKSQLSRRQLLEAGVLGAFSLSAGCGRRGSAAPMAPPERAPAALEVRLKATPARVLVDGRREAPTNVLRFEGTLLAGPSGALSQDETRYLGPTFRVRPGERVRVLFENGLGEPSIVHWHGLDVAEENDGHPRFAVGAGGHRRYELRVENRPGTYWYHPHPHERTGYQVQAGMAGLFIVGDGDDVARGLPGTEFDLPLVVQDRIIDAAGELLYAPDPMLGFLGDRVLVNGRTDASFDVRAGTYRLRLLNGSNARIYKLAWSDGRPMQVIGTDGGLLAAPVTCPYLMLAPAERAEVWADFAGVGDGNVVWLESRPFTIGDGMMGGGMMGMGMMGGGRSAGRSLPNGAPFRICRFAVTGKGTPLPVPRHFSPLAWRSPEEVVNRAAPRRFTVSMAMMRWMLNGHPFEMDDLDANERIRLGVTEDWEFANTIGTMTTAHPIHVHGGQFQIVERRVAPSWREAAATMEAGLVDAGWKDTFLLRPGERVRIRVRFTHHAGLFLYHCHNLEHEDMGMMRNFRVDA